MVLIAQMLETLTCATPTEAPTVACFSRKGARPGPRLQAGHRLGQRNVGL